MRMAWMAQRVEAEAAGRAQALGEAYAPVLDELAACLRERAEARPRFDEALRLGRHGGRRARSAAARCSATRPPTPGRGRRSRASFDAIALPFPAIYARYRAAEAHVTAGDRAAAAAPLRAAAAARASAMGAALLAADVAALARRARIDLDAAAAPRRDAEPDDSPVARLGLTPRELEVLLLVAEGRTNRAIGETLFMSEKTASVHVSRILAKLGVHGRVEAAAVAHRLGLAGATR